MGRRSWHVGCRGRQSSLRHYRDHLQPRSQCMPHRWLTLCAAGSGRKLLWGGWGGGGGGWGGGGWGGGGGGSGEPHPCAVLTACELMAVESKQTSRQCVMPSSFKAVGSLLSCCIALRRVCCILTWQKMPHHHGAVIL